ncbi:solute carrier family 41 member 2-like isoform X2 [Rhodnius prolixus]|uniref:solute carrier family 41 member 2-like isoform X2 n=1 Tax=Rhodnius prolixus TaxID=13249 RepID=UPI003D18CA44
MYSSISVGKMEVEDVHIDTTAALHPESRLSIPTANRLDDDQETKETFLTILYQVVGPLLISGLAMVGAGIYFDFVQEWVVFRETQGIIILMPALLGLKGNLEMTLASRLSTEANLGRMADPKELKMMIMGNLAVVQCQAIVVGFLSSLVAVILLYLFNDEFSTQKSVMLCACSVTTASVASFLLGVLTVGIIMSSVYFKVNPDNVTTPVAAGLGDIISLILLSYIASALYNTIDNLMWISIACVIFFMLLMPLWVYIASNNEYTRHVLTTGWFPILAAMFISTIAGLILGHYVKKYKDLSAYQPVINGVGGNLVSIQASRLSTTLHKCSVPLGQLPDDTPIVLHPFKMFSSNEIHSLTCRVLLSLVLPGHVLFVLIIVYLKTGSIEVDPMFAILYLTAAIFQVSVLLYMAYVLTHFFWSLTVDPDSTTIPFLTSLGDLLGIILLGLVYTLLANMSHNPHSV